MHIEASAIVRAPQERVCAVFTDVTNWPRVFPAIAGVRTIRDDPPRVEVLLEHREGLVPNELIIAAPDLVLLEERKKHYRATFVNRFRALPDGTTSYEVRGWVTLFGWRRLLQIAARPLARRRLSALTVQPVKAAAESSPGLDLGD